jgi:hypothetical protein
MNLWGNTLKVKHVQQYLKKNVRTCWQNSSKNARIAVSTALLLSTHVLYNVTLSCWEVSCRCFHESQCPRCQLDLQLKALWSFDTSETLYLMTKLSPSKYVHLLQITYWCISIWRKELKCGISQVNTTAVSTFNAENFDFYFALKVVVIVSLRSICDIKIDYNSVLYICFTATAYEHLTWCSQIRFVDYH